MEVWADPVVQGCFVGGCGPGWRTAREMTGSAKQSRGHKAQIKRNRGGKVSPAAMGPARIVETSSGRRALLGQTPELEAGLADEAEAVQRERNKRVPTVAVEDQSFAAFVASMKQVSPATLTVGDNTIKGVFGTAEQITGSSISDLPKRMGREFI